MSIRYMGNGRAAYTVTMPRQSHATDTSMDRPPAAQPVGYGQRGPWPLPPVGESQRRDPHIPDPVPGGNRPIADQRNASPEVRRTGGFNADGGIVANGLYSTVVYIKRIGSMMTRSLSREILMGVVDARWRVGGQGYPPEPMMGAFTVVGATGYHGDSTTVDPQNKHNPQVTARTPGVRPLYGVPASYRYAPVYNTMLYGQYQGRIHGGRPATAL